MPKQSAAAVKKPVAKKAAKPKESLVEWVMRGSPGKVARQATTATGKPAPSSLEPRAPGLPKPIPSLQRKAASSAVGPRYVTLQEWAATMFSKVPHANTLRRWVHDGHIQPQPRKIGRAFFVKVDAEYVD